MQSAGGPPDITRMAAPGLPSPESNQADGMGEMANTLATEIRDFHWKGLNARRLRDLTCEKYLLHVDGEGLSQWLDIYHGTRLKMSPNLTNVARTQNNQLRPIVDNFVAHLTTQPYRVTVNAKPDRRSREAALVDQAIVNSDIRAQKWNALFAEAKYIATVAGFCPIHAMWRDDPQGAAYNPVVPAMPGGMDPFQLKPGFIENWVGNPWDTVFNGGAKLNSLHRCTYGRVLPAQMVRATFQRPDLEGNDRVPSASAFQRVVQRWMVTGGFTHGTPAITQGYGGEEMIGLIYDELLPGVDPLWPEGRLAIIALDGMAATQRVESKGGGGQARLLWVGPLPASVFSFVNVYSHHRFDDIHGKPYVGDIDDDQIELNQLESFFNEFVRRATRPPLASSGHVSVDTISFRGDTLLEVEPMVGGGSIELAYLEQPARHMPVLSEKINRVMEGMYRKAGWQAASRGETSSGASGKSIIALQQADDSIFGPISQRTKEEVEALAQLHWRIRKQFMDVPMVLEVVGDELAHLAEPYVDRTMLSESPPMFNLVSGFGTSTEAVAQQLLNLVGMTDARGEQILSTRELRKRWPDASLFHEIDDPDDVRMRRPRVINEAIRQMAQSIREQFPMLGASMADPQVAMAAEYGALTIDGEHPILMDDSVEAHLSILGVITQDETEDPLARRIAIMRQQQYWMWLAGKQAAGAAAQQPQQGQNGTQQRQAKGQEDGFNQARQGGTTSASGMVQADKNFERSIA